MFVSYLSVQNTKFALKFFSKKACANNKPTAENFCDWLKNQTLNYSQIRL